MTMTQAVLWLDHQQARILRFDDTTSELKTVKAHRHETRQRNSAVRTEHEFFGSVCDALEGIPHVLVTSGHTSEADFRHYVTKHRHALLAHLAGWETVDRPTDGELVALGRKFFLAHPIK